MNALALDIPVLETERLVMSAPLLDHFEEEVAFYASDRSRGVGGPRSREDVWRILATMVGHWIFRGYGMWSVSEKATGRYCGRVGLWNPEGWPEPEVGWNLVAHAEGRGIAFEAARRARAWAYEVLGWTTLISLIAKDNVRSMALARRLGAVQEPDFQHPTHGAVTIWRHPGPEAAS